MPDNVQLFANLNDPSTFKVAREQLIVTLKGLGDELEQSIEDSASIAYKIAGFMATKYARSLEEGSPIDEILTIAGELEVNPDNVDELRQELIAKISACRVSFVVS